MSTLNWIGKEKVFNHHQEVPYKVLEKDCTYSVGQEVRNCNTAKNIIEVLKMF
ncbi:hypothetical protein [Flavobacterium okayamense]|uniref:Uncharacterized protein n=1 Tax=Flavobacterium okayamense TaxID=2830782 RepID=A0ABM7SAR9_9FLAO|nr:hypothetical protein [Flavobacterium okayamense]BCY28373.1 hypothetical protein KK2020170_12410 [Flavobacterium okayamense]